MNQIVHRGLSSFSVSVIFQDAVLPEVIYLPIWG
jgi:hypothetical protein